MSKIELIKKILKGDNKMLLKSKKDTIVSIAKIRNTPDDEYSLDGDAEYGRNAKAEVIESHQYHIGYVSGHDNLLGKIIELLDMSEDEIKQSLEEDKKVVKKNLAMMKRLMKEVSREKEDDDKDPHIKWCSAYGTGAPWAIDVTCNCPAAYVIRKRMSEGMTFEQAKQWSIDNDTF